MQHISFLTSSGQTHSFCSVVDSELKIEKIEMGLNQKLIAIRCGLGGHVHNIQAIYA